jgi:hypothetical protein
MPITPDNPNQTDPEFTGDYLKAFIALMLFKLGGTETISLEMLEKFPTDKRPFKIFYDQHKKAFTVYLDKKKKRGIITREMLANNS